MTDFSPSSPEREEVHLSLPDSKYELTRFTEYSFGSHFETATDGWSFELGAERISDELRAAIVPGARVQLTVNGGVQSTGYVDSIQISASRSSGTTWRIEGRDKIAQAVDACADPTKEFKEGMTLEQALVSLFAPYGWTSESNFIISNDADRDLKTGASRGTKRSKKGKALKSIVLHQLHPYPREGVYQFATRIAERFGLKIWPTASGDQLVVSKPDFDTDPFYKIRRNNRGTTNVRDGRVRYDFSQMPTLIVADGFSGGGEFGRGSVKAYAQNPSLKVMGGITAPKDRWPDAREVVLPSQQVVTTVPHERVLFLHDQESQTQEQVENFLKREMARLQRTGLSASYTVEGHGQQTPDGFVPWTVDTTVEVEDEIAGLYERLYVLGRTFRKSRRGGTTTELELIRLHTLEL